MRPANACMLPRSILTRRADPFAIRQDELSLAILPSISSMCFDSGPPLFAKTVISAKALMRLSWWKSRGESRGNRCGR